MVWGNRPFLTEAAKAGANPPAVHLIKHGHTQVRGGSHDRVEVDPAEHAKSSRWAELAKGNIDGRYHVVEWEVAAEGPHQYSGMVRIDGVTMSRKEAIIHYFAGTQENS
jgi:hypothetical protein